MLYRNSHVGRQARQVKIFVKLLALGLKLSTLIGYILSQFLHFFIFSIVEKRSSLMEHVLVV